MIDMRHYLRNFKEMGFDRSIETSAKRHAATLTPGGGT
jgi:hypothetical protein